LNKIRTAKINSPSKIVARKLVINVHPDQRMVATVPNNTTNDSIQKAMLKRVKWIWKNIE